MNTEQEDPGLPDLRALRRHPLALVLSVVAGVGAAVYFCQHATVVYQSTAQVLVIQREANPPTEQAVAVTGAVDEHVAKDLLGTHMQIIRSRTVLGRALESLGPVPSLQAALEEGQTPIEYVLEHLVITSGGEGQAQTAQVLNVSFKHTHSEDAARILQAIVDVYQGFVRERLQDAGQQAAQLIGKARDELAAELARKEQAYREFRTQSPQLAGGDVAFNMSQARLREVETAIAEHKVRYAQLEARAAIVKAVTDGTQPDLEKMASIGAADIGRLSFLVDIERGDPASEATRDQEIARYDQQLALRLETAKQLLTLRLEARKLENQFGADNPGLLATRAAIHELEAFESESPALAARDSEGEVRPAELMSAYASLIAHDLQEEGQRSQELEAQAAAEKHALSELVAAGLTDESLHREVELARAAYDGVARRLQDLNLMKGYDALITEVISPVLLGEQVWPKPLLLYALGAFVGMLLGTAAALLLELRVQRFRGAEEIEQALQVSVLTHIPDLAKRKNGGRGADRFLVARQRPDSAAAEAFRNLRTALCFGRGAQESNVIQVTSPSAGDGTTTLVTNLALSLAQTGKRVVVVDANLREPRVHGIFSVDPASGLSSYLSGEAQLEHVLRPTEYENLFVIPGGPAASAPSELLSLPAFDQLIAHLRESFDFVLVDSPPLLGSSDALVVSARADGVLLQIRSTRKGRITAMRARARLRESRAALMGLAVRDSDVNGTIA